MTAAASDSNDVGSAFIRLNLSLESDKEGENITLEMKPKEFFAMLSQLESARYCLHGANTN